MPSHLSNGVLNFPHFKNFRPLLSKGLNNKTPYRLLSSPALSPLPLQVIVHKGTTSLKSLRTKRVEMSTPLSPQARQNAHATFLKRVGKPMPLRLSFTVFIHTTYSFLTFPLSFSISFFLYPFYYSVAEDQRPSPIREL